jgi:ribosomal protein S18 acetylase RimI-like enzyme
VTISDAEPGDIERCAGIACDSEIGRRYGFERVQLVGKMKSAVDSGLSIVVAREAALGDILGFAWFDPKGAFGSAPYLKLIAVGRTSRGSGIGATLLAEYERRTSKVGRFWTLMVSDFNDRAIAFYERHGYAKAGELPGFAREGITEILMAKPKP